MSILPHQEYVLDLINMLGFNCQSFNDLYQISILRDDLLDPNIYQKMSVVIPELRKCYNSNMLSCLHKNSNIKQKFPAINLIRQILKCNDLLLKPYIISQGYDKATGKKLITRYFRIIPIDEDVEDNNDIISLGENNENSYNSYNSYNNDIDNDNIPQENINALMTEIINDKNNYSYNTDLELNSELNSNQESIHSDNIKSEQKLEKINISDINLRDLIMNAQN